MVLEIEVAAGAGLVAYDRMGWGLAGADYKYSYRFRDTAQGRENTTPGGCAASWAWGGPLLD